MNRQSHLKFTAAIVIGLGIMLLSSLFYIHYRLSATFAGTYIGSGVWFAITPDEQTFYCTDRDNNRYILGSIENKGNNVYFLSCAIDENRAYLADQEIIFHHYRKSFTLSINGYQSTMVKTDEGVIVNLEYDNYH